MRRLASFSLIASLFAVFIAACERTESDVQPEPQIPQIEVDVTVSDQLPNLSAPATGIAFWEHPTLPFNGLMIVANSDGLVSYNIEDGNEVGRVPGVNTSGAAISYLGYGPQAAGILATLDADENLFRFYGISNASRTFLPIEGGPAIRGNVRGFCFGRAQTADAPTLFVVQNSTLSIFNFDAADAGVALSSETEIIIPDTLNNCAIDVDGVVLLTAQNGDVYRLAAQGSFDAPFATLEVSDAGDINIAASETDGEITGFGMVLNKENGALHVFDRNDGRAIGVITTIGNQDLDGVATADVMGVSTSNLGGLYRNGAIAFGTASEEGPVLRLIPINGILNALSLTLDAPIRPRGEEPENDNDGLIIDISIETPE